MYFGYRIPLFIAVYFFIRNIYSHLACVTLKSVESINTCMIHFFTLFELYSRAKHFINNLSLTFEL